MPPEPSRSAYWIGILAVLNLAVIALLFSRPYFSNASKPVSGITNPVLAIQMARTVDDVDNVLGEAPSPDREAMRIKQYADFAFIACYVLLFATLGVYIKDARWKSLPLVAAALGAAAGVFDVFENIATLKLVDVDLAHTTQKLIDAIHTPSIIKWTLASLAMLLFAALLLRASRTSIKVVGLFDLAAALLGLYGLHDPRFFGYAGLPSLGSLVLLAILFFRPYVRR